MSQQETAREEWERLCGELNASPYHSEMTREKAGKLNDEFFTRNSYDLDKFWAMIDARERMESEESAKTTHVAEVMKPGRMHPVWERSNEKLLDERGGGGYGQL